MDNILKIYKNQVNLGATEDFVESEIQCPIITFKAGTKIFELVTPVAKQFILLSEHGEERQLVLPEGWIARSRILEKDLELEQNQRGGIKAIHDNLGNIYVRAFQFDGQADGQNIYELIGILGSHGSEAWVTFANEEKAKKLDKEKSMKWFVNTNYYVAYASRHTFLKSPSKENGRFRMKEFYGETFAENAKVMHIPLPHGKGLLQRYTIRKFHEMTYFKGMTLGVLTNPSGEDFLQFDIPLRYKTEIPRPKVPCGWKYAEYLLEQNYHVDMFGDVTRLLSMTSLVGYQGPINASEIPGKRVYEES